LTVIGLVDALTARLPKHNPNPNLNPNRAFSIKSKIKSKIRSRSKSTSGVLVTPEEAATPRLRTFSKQGTNAVVLYLPDGAPAAAVRTAVRRIRAAGLAPYYWIEVGRSPALADAHPEWM